MDSPNPKQKASSSTQQQPPPSSPTPKQLSDALRIASSLFAEGLVKLNSGAFTEALPLFEQALSVNQRYLPPSKTECVLCYNQLAAVHDKLGNLQQAFEYYERAKQELSAKEPPKGERDFLSRFKRKELLKQVQQKLERMPRTGTKVGAGAPLADVRALYRSLSSSGEEQLRKGNLAGARLAFEQALAFEHSLSETEVSSLRKSLAACNGASPPHLAPSWSGSGPPPPPPPPTTTTPSSSGPPPPPTTTPSSSGGDRGDGSNGVVGSGSGGGGSSSVEVEAAPATAPAPAEEEEDASAWRKGQVIAC